jgi:glycosyltransferase involved in cell wall biosynthesis
MPQVSILMSVYKESLDWLRQSIDSILEQTFTDFEFIIICDNPEYIEGIALLKEYSKQEHRIKLVFNQVNIGLTKSLNKGIQMSNGYYIARMDADDIALADRLDKQVRFFQAHPEVGVLGGGIEEFGRRSSVKLLPKTNCEMFLFVENCFAHPTVMAKADLLRKYLYNEDCRYAQDYELWYRMYRDGIVFYNLQEPLIKHRVSTEQVGFLHNDKQREVGKAVRRNSLNDYLKANYPNMDNLEGPVTMSFIKLIAKNVNLPKDSKEKLLYIMLLSLQNDEISLPKLLLIIRSLRLRVSFGMSVIYHYIKRNTIQLI